uniref:Selenoprotein P n=1 Tax=Cairina moschata TaxID=8855 RepID=A0A8C3BF63_CAIMO
CFCIAKQKTKQNKTTTTTNQTEKPNTIDLWSCFFTFSSRLEDLRVKLENEGLVNISYVVVNHQGAYSQKKFHLLKESVSEYITVYQQDEHQADVWTTLNGNKDDFLIYDRCGRLVYHLGLPYSFLSFNYVEEAIKIAYCENKCGNCSYTEPDIGATCENITKKADEKLAEVEPKPSGQHSNHNHQLHRHRHHHHHHRHSKNQNHQAPSETQRRHPHSGRRHRVFDHNIHDQTGSHEQVEIVPPGEGVEILRQDTKL